MIRALAFLILSLTAVHAQDVSLRYATTPDIPTAQALSAAAWAAMRCTPQPQCDPAQVTQYNYPIIGLSDGTRYAIVIHTGDVYQGEHLSLPNGRSFNLTAGQIASLATRAGMGTLLGDILPIALVNSRVTAPELSAINVYANAHPTFKTNFTTLTSGPIDLQNPLTNTVFNELVTAGVLTSARVAVILAPQATSVVTP